VFAESPFNYAYKGLDIYRYDHFLENALESSGEHSCDTAPSWDFYKLAPGEYEKILDGYDVIVFSDVKLKIFQLAPQFFDRIKFGSRVLTYPDRVRLTVEAVRGGKRVMFLGGWLSFTGAMGKGGWNRSGLKEILPVRCLDYEDLVESTEGFTARREDAGFCPHVDFSDFPPILGYNKTLPRKEASIHLAVKETGDPLMSTLRYGKGTTLAYTSDPAPHWGCNFIYWSRYNDFWLACLDYLMRLR